MDPDEHSRFLQNAVSLWDIADANGHIFPKEIPRDAFPSEPDPEMLEWHEGVCKRLEQHYVTRNTHSSPANFGAYHHHLSGNGPPADEGDYFSRDPRRSGSRHHGHFDSASNRSSRLRRHRRLSADLPVNGRIPVSAYFYGPEEVRSGFSSPRAASPPPERPLRSRGRDRATWYGHPISPWTSNVPDASDASSENSYRGAEARKSKSRNRGRRRNLSPPPHTRARRHSHDAYTPRPSRDISPAAPRRLRRSKNAHASKSTKSSSDSAPKVHPFEDYSWTRAPGVKFKENIFDDPATAPALGSPAFAQAPPPPPPRYMSRHRMNLDPYTVEESGRGTHNGGTTAGSRPGSRSRAERPRSFSSAGFYVRPSRWASPVRSSAAKRYIPTSVAEDAEDIALKRAPVHD